MNILRFCTRSPVLSAVAAAAFIAMVTAASFTVLDSKNSPVAIAAQNTNSLEPLKNSMIAEGSDVLTMVNVITPASGSQDEAILLLKAAMADEMRYQPGFISANIHRSLDSEHIVVYAQWQDLSSVEDAVKVIQSGGAPTMAQVFSIAQPDFHPYEVVSVHTAPTQ